MNPNGVGQRRNEGELELIPDDPPYSYRRPTVFVEKPEVTYLEILRGNAVYDRLAPGPSVPPSFELFAAAPESLREYGYHERFPAASAPDDARAFRLLSFVCDHFGHDGSNGSGGAFADGIVRFCREHGGKTNCRGLAILLATLLRVNGIKACHVTCMPYEEPFDDCHVVVDCLLPSGRRVMLDPTMRLYYRDARGELVSLARLRRMLIAGEALFPNADASYNGEGFDDADYREYMAKNTLRFARCSRCADGVDGPPHYLQLCPAGYPADRLPRNPDDEFIFNDEAFWKI